MSPPTGSRTRSSASARPSSHAGRLGPRSSDTVRRKIGEEHAFIFDAHLLILDDLALSAGFDKLIREENVRAESALADAYERYRKIFDALDDEYFMRQRKRTSRTVLAKTFYRNLEI